MLHRQRAMQQNLATAGAFVPRSPITADLMPIAYPMYHRNHGTE